MEINIVNKTDTKEEKVKNIQQGKESQPRIAKEKSIYEKP